MAETQPFALSPRAQGNGGAALDRAPEWVLWTLASAAILAFAVAAAAYVYGREARESHLLLETVARLKAAELGVWLREREADARFLENHSVAGRLYQQWREGDVGAGSQLRQRLEEYRMHNGFAAVALADRDGATVLELGEPLGLTPAQVTGRVRRAGERVILELSPSGEAGLSLVAPLPAVDARPAPHALVRIDPVRSLGPMLRDEAVGDGRLLLVRRDGGAVRVFDADRRRPPLDSTLLANLADLEESPLVLADGEGRPHVALLKPLAGGRIGLALILDRGRLLAEANRSAAWAGLATALALFAATALALTYRQRQRLRLEAQRQEDRAARVHVAELLDAIVESSPDAVFAKDLEGRYLLCNAAAARLLGRRREDVEGRRDDSIFDARLTGQLREQDRAALERGHTVTFEERLVLPGGERVMLTTKGPLRGADGSVTGVFGVSRDVTERRQQDDQRRAIAERLRESEAHYRSIVAALAEGVIEISAQGEVRAVNASAERILGMTAAELRASWAYLSEWNTVREDGNPYTHDTLPLVRVLATGQSQQGALVGMTHPRTGRIVWLRMNAEPLFDSVGAVQAAVISFLDITERVAIDRELARHRERLEELVASRTAMLESTLAKVESFSYTISHDLRAPLRAIHGYSTLLEAEAGPGLEPSTRRLLEGISSAALRMNALLEDIHAYSRADHLEMKPQRVDLGRVARDVVAQLGPAYPAAEVVVHDLPAVWADPTMMQQVLSNLVGNALKFSSKVAAPRIEVGFEESAEGPEFHVRDNGAGFDMRYANQLFGLFKRLHRESDFPGTGLGLAIVKHLVERHGGGVEITSAEGVGTTVRFTLGTSGPVPATRKPD